MRKKENCCGRTSAPNVKTYFSTYTMRFFSASEVIRKYYTAQEYMFVQGCKTTTVCHKDTAGASFFIKESPAYVFHLSAWLRWTCTEDTFVTLLSFPSKLLHFGDDVLHCFITFNPKSIRLLLRFRLQIVPYVMRIATLVSRINFLNHFQNK